MKVGFLSLGCPKNLVDTEVMMGQLAARGHLLTPHPEEADVTLLTHTSLPHRTHARVRRTWLRRTVTHEQPLERLAAEWPNGIPAHSAGLFFPPAGL